VDFQVPANDSAGIMLADQGFGVVVGWDLTSRGARGAITTTTEPGRTVLVTSADPSVTLFAAKAPATPSPALGTEGAAAVEAAASAAASAASAAASAALVGAPADSAVAALVTGASATNAALGAAYAPARTSRVAAEAAPSPVTVSGHFNVPDIPGNAPDPLVATVGNTWVPLDSNGSLDMVIQANVGDLVDVTFSATVESADYCLLDFAAVSGSAVRSWGSGIAPANNYCGSWGTRPLSATSGVFANFTLSQEVKASDLNGGYLTLRPYWRNETNTAASIKVYTNANNGPMRIRLTNHRSRSVTVLKPTLAWEQAGVSEVSVWLDDVTWCMTYTGGLTLQGIGYATASAPLGPWTKQSANPLFGLGFGGFAAGDSCARSSIYREGSSVYLYFSCGGTLWMASGPDVLHLGAAAIVFPPNATWTGIENTCVVKVGAVYHMMFESRNAGVGPWVLGHATATSPSGPWTVAAFPVTALEISAGINYSGPWLGYVGGQYVLWYHADYPALKSRIYKATSPDCVTWTVKKLPVISPLLATEQSQVADPWLTTDGLTWYAYWEGVLAADAGMEVRASVPARYPIIP
jgi:hypothetical protein